MLPRTPRPQKDRRISTKRQMTDKNLLRLGSGGKSVYMTIKVHLLKNREVIAALLKWYYRQCIAMTIWVIVNYLHTFRQWVRVISWLRVRATVITNVCFKGIYIIPLKGVALIFNQFGWLNFSEKVATSIVLTLRLLKNIFSFITIMHKTLKLIKC